MIGINRDITEQKLAEEALATSEKRYRHLVDSGQGLIFTHDLDGKLLSVNPAAAESLGCTPDEMVGRNLIEYLTPAVHFPHYLKRIRSEPNVNGLLHLLNKQGEERIWMYRNSRIAEPGAMTYVLGSPQEAPKKKTGRGKGGAPAAAVAPPPRGGKNGGWDGDNPTKQKKREKKKF